MIFRPGPVVDDGRKRLGAEASMRHQHRAQQTPGQKKYLRRQHDAGELDREFPSLWIEPGKGKGDQRRRRDPQERGRRDGHDAEGSENAGQHAVPGQSAVPFAHPVVERDECDRECAPREQVVEKIRD